MLLLGWPKELEGIGDRLNYSERRQYWLLSLLDGERGLLAPRRELVKYEISGYVRNGLSSNQMEILPC